MKVIITGATGYIGRHVLKASIAKGWSIVSLSRVKRWQTHPDLDWLFFDVNHTSFIDIPPDVDAVIHLATNTNHQTICVEREIASTQALVNASRDVGAKFVFVSSQSSDPNAKTKYGKLKYEQEQIVMKHNGCVLRPGLVYGSFEFGLFGKLCKTMRKRLWIPTLIPPPRIQPIHVDDLSEIILDVCKSNIEAAALNLGSETALNFNAFLTMICASRGIKKPFFVPVPTLLIKVILWTLGRYGRNLTKTNQLYSFITTKVMLTQNKEKIRDLRPVSFESIKLEKSRKAIILEAAVLLEYFLGARPRVSLTKTLAKILLDVGGEKPIGLPSAFLFNPCLISIIDTKKMNNSHFQKEIFWRIRCAAVVAECSTEGARKFLGRGHERNFPARIFVIFLWVSRELFFFLINLVPLIRRSTEKGSFAKIDDQLTRRF